METQTKERLTGAIILVALVVLLVPELLTGPGPAAPSAKSVSQTDAQMRSYTVDLAGKGTRHAAPVAIEQQGVNTLPAKVEEEGDALEAKVVPQEPVNEPAPIAKPVLPAPPVQAEPSAAPKPRAVAPGRSTKVDRVPSVEPMPVKGWSVQLGSFQSRDNAQRLVRELKSEGFQAFLLDGGGQSGKLYRVRVGPVPDRAAAATLAKRLRDNGQPGSIVPYP